MTRRKMSRTVNRAHDGEVMALDEAMKLLDAGYAEYDGRTLGLTAAGKYRVSKSRKVVLDTDGILETDE